METIKIAYDPSTKLYMIINTYRLKILWNGKEIKDPLTGSTAGRFALTEAPTSIQTISNKRSLTGYSDGNETITGEELNNRLDELVTGWDDEGNPIFSNIENRVRHTVISESFKPVYKDDESISDIEFEIIEYPVSQYPEIVPFYQMGTGDIYSTKCIYTPNLEKAIQAYLAPYDVDVHYSKSGLQFMKINGKYLQNNDDIKVLNNKYTGSYEECVARMNTVHNRVKEILESTIALTSPRQINQVTIGMIAGELQKLKNNLNAIDPKQKTRNFHTNAIRVVNEINKMLTAQLQK